MYSLWRWGSMEEKQSRPSRRVDCDMSPTERMAPTYWNCGVQDSSPLRLWLAPKTQRRRSMMAAKRG